VDKHQVGLEKCSRIVARGEKLRYWKIEEKSSEVTSWMRLWQFIIEAQRKKLVLARIKEDAYAL
jgi:hypothetical protein